MDEFKFKQNDRVNWQVAGLKGVGLIKGAATTPMPVMGRMFIVEDTSGALPTQEYPFTTLTVAECGLTFADEGTRR